MKALMKLQNGPGHVALQDVPEPQPRAGQVLVEVGAVGICGTDLHIRDGEYPVRPPVILGHEFAGTIVQVGEGVTDWAVGERVTVLPFSIVCGRCEHCRAGEYGLCAQRRSHGSGVDGAFASHVAVNTFSLRRLPPNQDFIAGALSEPLACVTKGMLEVGHLQTGERAVILGPGAIGLLATQVAVATGAEVTLIGLKSDAVRLETGRALGATRILYADEPDASDRLRQALDAEGADVVFECSGAGAAFRLALQLVRKRGRIVQIGLFGRPVEADLDTLVFKDVTLKGSFTSSLTSWEKALTLMGNGKVNTRRVVSDVFPLAEWETAFQRAASRSGLKVVVQP